MYFEEFFECSYKTHFFCAYSSASQAAAVFVSSVLGCGTRGYTTGYVWATAGLRGGCSELPKSSGLALFQAIAFRPAEPSRVMETCFFFFVHSSCFRSATVPAVPRFPQGIPCTWYTRYSLTQASPVQQQLQLFFTRLLFVTAHGRRLRACVPSYCRILGILNSGTRYQEDLSKFSPGVLVVFARLSAVAAAAVYV